MISKGKNVPIKLNQCLESWRSRTVSPPSERKVICWFSWNPCDCKTSYRRRFDLVSTVCTKPKRLLEGVSSSSSRVQARVLLPTMTSTLGCFASQSRTEPPSMPLPCSSPSSASQRSAIFSVSCRTVLASSVTASGRKSVSASTVKPYETSEAHCVSIKRSSGATDSGRRADSGRNEVVLRRVQRQWHSRGPESLKVPNKVRNDR